MPRVNAAVKIPVAREQCSAYQPLCRRGDCADLAAGLPVQARDWLWFGRRNSRSLRKAMSALGEWWRLGAVPGG